MDTMLDTVVFRHGDRVPVVGLKGDDPVWECALNLVDQPAKGDAGEGSVKDDRLFRFAQLAGRNVLPGNCSLGQLTEIGHEQHKIIGSHFRALYHDVYGFLPSEYNADDVWVRAINIPRCRQSAQSEIEGMFPRSKAHTSSEKSHDPQVQVVPVHTMDPNTENMSPNFDACPNLINRIAAQQESPAWAAFNKATAGMTARILDILKYTSASEVGSTQYPFYIGVFDDFACRNCHDLGFPAGVDQSLFEDIVSAGTFTVNHWLFNETMASIAVGTFFGELLDAMDQVRSQGDNYSGPILRLYGGQDLTIAPLLNCLHVYNGVWPPYAAHLSLELWSETQSSSSSSSTKSYYVRLIYNGETLVIPGCSEFCPWSDFSRLVADSAITQAQYEAMCAVSDPHVHIDMFS